MEKQLIQNYRELIGILNNHESHIAVDKLTFTGFFTTQLEYIELVGRMLKSIPTNELDNYKEKLNACNYDVEFIKGLRK